MKTATFVTSLVFALNANSMSMIDAFQSAQKQNMQKQTLEVQSQRIGNHSFGPISCTNFTGSWKGQCTNSTAEGNTTEPSSMTIVQDRCSSVKVNDENINLGAVTSKQEAGSFLMVQTNTILDWNKDATEINLDLDVLVKITLPQGEKISPRIGGRIYFDNGSLIAELNGAAITTKCVYRQAP